MGTEPVRWIRHWWLRFRQHRARSRTTRRRDNAVVRETPTLYDWDFGDGRTANDGHPSTFATNTGLGRAYTDPYSPSPVLHKYVLSSLKFVDQGGFPIVLKITWHAQFRVNGGG